MKKTYLLIETVTESFRGIKFDNIENIFGVSDDIDTLKEVAREENAHEPLDWFPTLSGNWKAYRNSTHRYEIVSTNKYLN